MPGECRGFVFEMDEVARCVRNGKLESSVMPAGASIVAMKVSPLDRVFGIQWILTINSKIFDEIRRQTSLVFPSDSQSL